MSGINARQWFYGTSFHSSEPLPERRTESGLDYIRSPFIHDKFHVLSAAGHELTCRCGRVLYFKEVDNELRAECCGRVHHERIRQ